MTMIRWWLPFTLGVALGVSVGLGPLSAAYEQDESSRRSSQSQQGQTEARRAASSDAARSSVERKLDQILANQETILQQFEVIKEELRIIKVRSSLR